jgi:TPR repeat protein
MNNLGWYYQNIEENYELMKKYYEQAIELGNSNAMCNLGYYYQYVEKNYELMKLYYERAVEHNISDAVNNLGIYYQKIEKNYELMKKYYEQAIELGNSNAMYNLGLYYEKIEIYYELMKKYYIKALLNGFIQYNNIPNEIISDAIINHNYIYKGYDYKLKNINNNIFQFNNLDVIEINECTICYNENCELKYICPNKHLLCKTCYIKLNKCPYCRYKYK